MSLIDILRKISLSARVSAAPFLAVALTVVLLVLADRQTDQALAGVEAIHQETERRQAEISDLLAIAYRIHSEVARHLALVESGTSETKLRDIRASVDGDLGRARTKLATLKETGASPLLADIERRLADYALAVAQMNDMAQSDRLIAIPLLSHVDTDFSELTQRIVEAQTGINAAAQAAIQAQRDETAATARSFLILAAATVGLFVALTLLVTHSITAPLGRLTRAMRAIAEGRLDTPVEGITADDEIGAMARALDVLKSNTIEARTLRARQDRQGAEAEAEKQRALARMAETIEAETGTAVDRVIDQTQAMASHAVEMERSASRVLGSATSVASASGQSLSNAETVSAAAEQLSASIAEIGLQVEHATDVTRHAVNAANDAQRTMTSLAETVTHISTVAGLIADIASQTNLLALNATIEAARAGDAGKGFAVVAGEVKTLAAQTARSTDEISRRITEISTVTGETFTSVQSVLKAIAEVGIITESIAAAVQQQGAATSEIARNVQETTEAAMAVSSQIAKVSTEATRTGTHAGQVRAVAEQVASSVENLRQVLVQVVRQSLAKV